MNGRIVGSKPLYVALAQRKEDRKAHLTSQYMQRMVNINPYRMPQVGPVYNPGGGAIFLPTTFPPQRMPYGPNAMGGMRPSTRWAGPARPQAPYGGMQYRQPVRGGAPNVNAANAQPGMRAVARLPAQGNVVSAGPAPRAMANGPQVTAVPQPGVAQPRGPAPVPPQYKYSTSVRAPNPAAQQQPGAGNQGGPEPLSASALAAAHPSDQKQMLGERLFPLIHEKYPNVAGKVTGMLLEMDNAEILHLLEDRDLMTSRVDEAVAVLQIHQKQPAGASS